MFKSEDKNTENTYKITFKRATKSNNQRDNL